MIFVELRLIVALHSVNCKHHISREALVQSWQGKQSAKCPVAGCSGQWTKVGSSLDEDYQLRVDRFVKKHAAALKSGSSQSQHHATSIDLEDEDEEDDQGYTQL